MQDGSPTARRVAMLVRNAYTHDTRVEKEASTLADAGYDVTVVADAAPGLPLRETRQGTRVVRVPRSGPRIPGLRFIVHEARLARVIRNLRPDVIHAHDSNALLPVALAARALGVPFVYDAHDLWLGRPRRERSVVYFALNQLYYTFIERAFVPSAAAAMTVSRPIADHLARRYGLPSVSLVPNYPEPPGELERHDLRSLHGGGGIGAETPIVLYLGGLMAGRGLDELVDAMTGVERGTLVLLGDGVIADALLRRAASAGIGYRVLALPPVPPAEVVAHAASASVGVSPIVPSCLNYRYSLPNKLFQYMAAAIPVVASDFPQVREIIEGADCGYVVDTTRPGAIAAAIERLLADPEAAVEMGERGRRAIEERYNWSTSARELRRIYAELPAG